MNNPTQTVYVQVLPDNAVSMPKMSVFHKVAWASVTMMIFLIPWGDGLYDGIGKIFGMLGLAMALSMLVLEGTHSKFSPFNIFSLMLGGSYLLGIVWTSELEWGKEILRTHILLILMSLLYTYLLDGDWKFRCAYQAYVLGGIAASIFIFILYSRGVTGPYYNRFTVPNIETDNMGILLALAIPMAVWLYTQYQNRLYKLANLATIPIIFYGIFLTGTRTALVAGVMGLAYWAFTQRKASFSLKLVYVIGAVGAGIAVISLAPKASVERIFSIFKSVQAGDLNYRQVIWQFSIEGWKDAPILGHGTGSLGHVLNPYHVEFHAAHNAYIQILSENGIIGLGIYLLMIFSLFYFAFKCPINLKVFLLTLLFIIAVTQMTLHSQNLKEVWFVWSAVGAHGYHSYVTERLNQRSQSPPTQAQFSQNAL